MMLYRDKYRVETTRLQGWDYARPSWYFVTICTRDRQCLLGEIVEGQVRPSATGLIARQGLHRVFGPANGVRLDALVVMPNHVHAIVEIEARPGGAPPDAPPTPRSGNIMAAIAPKAGSLGAMVRSYKAAVSRRCGASIWQDRYYEHIIRDDRELAAIRGYIANNPIQWQEDRLHPDRADW